MEMHIVCSIAWNRKSHHQKDFRTFIPMLFFSFGFLIFGMHLLAKSEGNPWYHSQVSSKTHNKESRKSKGLGPVNRFVIHTYQISVSLASIIDSMWTMRERKRSQESGCHRDHCPAVRKKNRKKMTERVLTAQDSDSRSKGKTWCLMSDSCWVES